MSQINLVSPAGFTSGILVADAGNSGITGASNDSIGQLTTVNGLPLATCCEFQSTLGAVTLPRMTTAQINALGVANVSSVTNGMIAFNSTTQNVVTYQNGSWGAGPSNTTFISITSDQFGGTSSIYATPIILIPAAGAGTLIIVERFYLQLLYPAAAQVAYAGGGAVSLQYGTTVHAGGTLATATIAAADIIAASNPAGGAASTLFTAAGVQLGGTPGTATAALSNQPISISNATAAFTAGNSTFYAYVIYRVIQTA